MDAIVKRLEEENRILKELLAEKDLVVLTIIFTLSA